MFELFSSITTSLLLMLDVDKTPINIPKITKRITILSSTEILLILRIKLPPNHFLKFLL